MIVSNTDIEAYLNFIKKALGEKRGYIKKQKREIIQQFYLAGITNLENLAERLEYLLENSESSNNFSLEDVQEMLANCPNENDIINPQDEYERLQTSLVIIPEDFKQAIFVINDVMTKFLYKYPNTAAWEILISSLKKQLKDFISKFF